ncbi:helix-turn-helix transcriptional regulator [Bradyrhizobium sp. JR3.5]
MITLNPSAGEPMLVSVKTTCALTSLSRAMLNRYRSEGRFPVAVPLGEKRIAFIKSEVTEWIDARIAARGANDSARQQRAA